MPRYKNYLEVERKKEPYIYDICKDLSIHGKTIVDTDSCNWGSISRKLGVRTKPLIEHTKKGHPDPLLYPIARTKNNRKNSLALIQVPNNVFVTEKNNGNKSIFKFLKKNIF